ncbi:MAG: hypothetical protein HUU06_07065 [Planctomycetaceae bacterium]|nr:hypothetical protein [Planctomycetota bacterium]NUN52529.1 hypothetical protein [Planctomycetaceae bacterium]
MSIRPRFAVLAFVALALLHLPAGPRWIATAPAEEPPEVAGKPFPVDRTQKLIEEGAVWTVEGRIRIPKGVEISLFRNCIVRAKGSGPAVIEVEGGLDAIGVLERETIFENVTVEPRAKFERIHMDMVIFRGGGGIRTPADAPADGYVLIENIDFVKGAVFDVHFQKGSVELSSMCADGNTAIRSSSAEGSKGNKVRVFVRGCHQEPRHRCSPHGGRVGLVGGLVVDGGDDITVQLSRIGGRLAAVRNWGQKLIFDGNKINSDRLELSHAEPGMFQKVQCAKLDVYSGKVSASAPAKKGVKDTFTMDRCWFKGVTDPKKVFEEVILDGADEPEKNGVRVQLPKINERPLELAGEIDR